MERKEEERRMGIDEMLRVHVGEFGRWQVRHFMLTCAAWALEAFHTMVMIFADRQPAWRCSSAVDCPPEPCSSASWEWVEDPAASTVSQWGLICANRYKIGLAQSAFFAGCMLGAGIFGHLSDSVLGRKGSLTMVCVLNGVSGIFTALSPCYWIYAALRFINGVGSGGVGLCAFVLATEPIGQSKRGIAGMSTFYFFSGGIAILSGIAYLFPTWRILYIVTSLPSILFVFFVLPFVSESPRWFLIRRRTSEAMDLMRSIARSNGREIPPDVTLQLDGENDDQEKECSQQAKCGSIVDVVRSPRTRWRLFLMILINFCCAVVYYGLTLNVVNLRTNLYLSVVLNSVAEMPAFVVTAVLLDRLGRKPMGIATMALSGFACLIAFSVTTGEEGSRTIRMACGVIGIFGMAAMYNLLFIYTAELFPTVVRNAALGCVTQASQMGAILAPLVVVTGERLPFGVFAACGISGALLTYYLPETMNKPLYDTMTGLEDAEASLLN